MADRDTKAVILAEHLARVRRRLLEAEADADLLRAKVRHLTWRIAMNELLGDHS